MSLMFLVPKIFHEEAGISVFIQTHISKTSPFIIINYLMIYLQNNFRK